MTDVQFDVNNYDASGLMQIMSLMANKAGRIADDDGSNKTLTDLQIDELYENSKLIQKIINKYPEEFKTLGYEIRNSSGELIEKDNDVLLESFKDALISSRLYGRSFLKLEFDDFNDTKILKRGSKLIGYSLHYDLHQVGDFFNIESKPVHFSRVIEFIGVKTYKKHIKKNDPNYCRSVLQSLYVSFSNFIDNNYNAKYLLNNLSYLTIGIENLGNMQISDEGKRIVFDRLTALNINRSISRIMAYDKSKEAIGFISQTLTGVNDLVEQSKSILASESDYPVSEIFETNQSQALGTGIQNQLVARYLWARRVRNWSINNALPYLKIYFNRTRDMSELEIWIPFIVDLTDEEKADIEKKAADRSKVLIDAGIISPEEARSGYKGDIFTLNIKLNDAEYLAKDDKDGKAALLKDINNEKKLNQEQNTPASNTDAGAEVIPDDKFWDDLATITSHDLDSFAEKVINEAESES